MPYSRFQFPSFSSIQLTGKAPIFYNSEIRRHLQCASINELMTGDCVD